MRTVCLVLFTALGSGLRRQAALQIENAAPRHQLAVLQRQKRGRPQLRPVDRLFWTWLCRLWPGWRRALVIVKPDTVLRWHRRGFRFYWRWKSRPRGPGWPASRAPSKRSSTRCAVPTRYEGRRLAILTRREQIKRRTLQQRRRENLHTPLRAINRQEVSLRKETHWPTSV